LKITKQTKLHRCEKSMWRPVLFADDTSVLIMNCSPTDFIKDADEVFELLTK
jgi:hypothetical protein